jgi:hypothetical protein
MNIAPLVRGTIAGYIGTAVMDASQTSIIPAISNWIESLRANEQQEQQEGSSSSGGDGEEQPLSSPEKAAKRGADMLGIDLDRDAVAAWGNRIHWLYGTQWGVVYTLLRGQGGPLSGLLYGAFLWAASDELLLWALGIAEAPTEYPAKSHLLALASHCVYGMTVGIAARGLSRR